MRYKPIWDYETGVPRSQKKERIPRPELTWEDIMTIDVLLHDISDEKCTIRLKEFYKEVLRRFNEAKQKQK